MYPRPKLADGVSVWAGRMSVAGAGYVKNEGHNLGLEQMVDNHPMAVGAGVMGVARRSQSALPVGIIVRFAPWGTFPAGGFHAQIAGTTNRGDVIGGWDFLHSERELLVQLIQVRKYMCMIWLRTCGDRCHAQRQALPVQ